MKKSIFIWFWASICLVNVVSAMQGQGKRSSENLQPPHAVKKNKISSLTLTFYNVGQGNCVLAENHKTNQALLIDCGSIESKEEVRAINDKPLVNLDSIISDIRSKIKNKTVTIIITHLDRDHYNLIPKIFSPTSSDEETEKPIDYLEYLDDILKVSLNKIIVAEGKQPLDLKKAVEHGRELGDFASWVLSIAGFEASKDKYVGINENNLDLFNEILDEVNQEEQWVVPLAAAVTKSDDVSIPHKSESVIKNANSIVLRIGRLNSTCSALLPGDANAVTTDYIESHLEDIKETQKIDSLHTTVLLSSHHGSDQEDCNSSTWIKATAPQTIIISAGNYGKIGHPRCNTIQRYLNTLDQRLLTLKEPHELTCYQGFIDALSQNALLPQEERTHPFQGTEAIFNTFDHGAITVALDEETFELSSNEMVEKESPFIELFDAQCIPPPHPN